MYCACLYFAIRSAPFPTGSATAQRGPTAERPCSSTEQPADATNDAPSWCSSELFNTRLFSEADYWWHRQKGRHKETTDLHLYIIWSTNSAFRYCGLLQLQSRGRTHGSSTAMHLHFRTCLSIHLQKQEAGSNWLKIRNQNTRVNH